MLAWRALILEFMPVELLYGISVLLSGLGTLILDDSGSIIHHQHKTNLEHLQRVLPCTPGPVIMFLAGSPPASGHMLGYLGMSATLIKPCHPDQTLSPNHVTQNKTCHQTVSPGTKLVNKRRQPDQTASPKGATWNKPGHQN